MVVKSVDEVQEGSKRVVLPTNESSEKLLRIRHTVESIFVYSYYCFVSEKSGFDKMMLL